MDAKEGEDAFKVVPLSYFKGLYSTYAQIGFPNLAYTSDRTTLNYY